MNLFKRKERDVERFRPNRFYKVFTNCKNDGKPHFIKAHTCCVEDGRLNFYYFFDGGFFYGSYNEKVLAASFQDWSCFIEIEISEYAANVSNLTV